MILVIAAAAGFIPLAGLVHYTTSDSSFCLSCHAAGDTPDRGARSLVHPEFQSVGCVDCHAKPGQVVFEGYVQGFMAEPERIAPNCVRCHSRMVSTDEQEGFKFNFLEIRNPHKLHLDRGATCTTCHANVAHDLNVPRTNRPRMETCYQCHALAEACATCHSKAPPTGNVPVPALAPLAGMADGRVLYLRTCSGCHGSRGEWVAGANLRSGELLSTLTDEQLIRIVTRGAGAMPAFGKARGGDLTDDQTRAIVGYLRSAEGKPSTPNGPALFQSNCVTCHGSAGDRIPAARLSSREFLDGRSRASLRLAVSRGKGGMPAFARDWGGPLQPDEARTVVGYLWTLARGASGEPAVSADEGKALYASFCVACHGLSGGQFPAADLTSAAFLRQRTDDELVEVTNDGRGIMPGFGPPRGQLSVEQIAAIVGYLRSVAR